MKELEWEYLKPSEAKVTTERMNPLQLLNNTKVKIEEEPIDQEVLASILRDKFYQRGLMCAIVKLNGVEVRAMIDTGAIATLVKANLVPHIGLQVARANIVVYLISYHQVVPISIAVANLSVGSWVLETTFVVMAISRFDVILGMEFLYNAEVHVLPHLSCIWSLIIRVYIRIQNSKFASESGTGTAKPGPRPGICHPYSGH